MTGKKDTLTGLTSSLPGTAAAFQRAQDHQAGIDFISTEQQQVLAGLDLTIQAERARQDTITALANLDVLAQKILSTRRK